MKHTLGRGSPELEAVLSGGRRPLLESSREDEPGGGCRPEEKRTPGPLLRPSLRFNIRVFISKWGPLSHISVGPHKAPQS